LCQFFKEEGQQIDNEVKKQMEKKLKVWIYEYKDDDTPIGATFLNKFIEDITDEDISLPHLESSWHWRINYSWEEKED